MNKTNDKILLYECILTCNSLDRLPMGLTPWTEGEEVILEWVNYARVDRVKVQFFWQLI